ncbi:MAG: hypothetical protein JNM69_19460 [Archangium sp.]|nr:hypothetical protein [Archangium sp.]
MAARRPRWVIAVRVVALLLLGFQLALMFAPGRFVGLLRLPMLAQFALGTAVLGAVVVEVLAAAGMLGSSAD